MDRSCNCLNARNIGCDPAKALDWCRKEQLEYSTPARLAHYIVCWKELIASSSNEVPEEHPCFLDKYLRIPLHDQYDPFEPWRKLIEWKHPRLDLNLLQLAVIFNVPNCISFLSHPVFMRENYRDEKSILVNHPFHLACRLGCSRILQMTIRNLPDEVFWEEGIVDLSQARIQRLPSQENPQIPDTVDPSADATPTNYTGVVSVANENELLAIIGRSNVTVNKISLGLTPTMGTCFSLTAEDDNNCVSHLFMYALDVLSTEHHQPRSSIVECMMKTVGNLCRRGMTVECFAVLMHNLSGDVVCVCRSLIIPRQFSEASEEGALSWKTYCREVTILVCQLAACVAENTGSWDESLELLCHLFVNMIDAAAVESVQKAASYLPRKHLPSIVRILHRQRLRPRSFSSSNWDSHFVLALNMFTDMAKETNLQSLCMLKILESVRGDARAARNLSALPEPLRKRFHVPFQDLYDSLSAASP